MKSINKPPFLRKGDTIGLITPAGFITNEKFEKTLENLKKIGLIPFYNNSLFDKHGYLAGDDNQRIEEIHSMYENKDIKGILCVRGGYGTTRILDKLDYNLINNNPKPLIGFSDITALISAIYKNTNSPIFHGAMGVSEFNNYTLSNFKEVLMSKYSELTIKSADYNENSDQIEYKPYIINKGIAKGKLVGGNLSLLVSQIGTQYDIDWTDKIVFIEEICEPPYKIDRMLTHLIMSGKLQNVAGIILGVFNKCEERENPENSLSLKQVITDRIKQLNVPSMYGFSFGHIHNQAIFPVGVGVEFDSETKRMKFFI